jgi:bifunctional non-homologous end joining protein LigD
MGKQEASEILAVGGREIRITHPDKLYFSEKVRLTKRDLVQYYVSIASGALTGIQDRPIVLKRFVNGAEKPAF